MRVIPSDLHFAQTSFANLWDAKQVGHLFKLALHVLDLPCKQATHVYGDCRHQGTPIQYMFCRAGEVVCAQHDV